MALAPGAATAITSNVLGARTDLELRNILTEHRNETVCMSLAHCVQSLRLQACCLIVGLDELELLVVRV